MKKLFIGGIVIILCFIALFIGCGILQKPTSETVRVLRVYDSNDEIVVEMELDKNVHIKGFIIEETDKNSLIVDE